MRKILLGTTNKGKVKELSDFLRDMPFHIVSLDDVGVTHEVKETGKTYKENAEQKAKEYSMLSGLPTIADDGGLEIDALDGAPGLKSHRWLGPHTTEDELFEHMRYVGKHIPENNRGARFVTVVAFAYPTGKVMSSQAMTKGIITREPAIKREKGYPYRSFFFIPKINKYYFDEDFTMNEREQFHHRYRAVRKLLQSVLL